MDDMQAWLATKASASDIEARPTAVEVEAMLNAIMAAKDAKDAEEKK